MSHVKYREDWNRAAQDGPNFGTSYQLSTIEGVPAVFVTDLGDRPLGAVKAAPGRIEALYDLIGGDTPAKTATFSESTGLTLEAVAALVEEMLSKGYDQMKARTLTVVEAASGQTDVGSKPLGKTIGYALDDAKRVMLDVLAKRAPEVTPEMIAEAAERRKEAETEEAKATTFGKLQWQVDNLRRRLASAEKDLEDMKADGVRESLRFEIDMAGPGQLAAIADTIRRGTFAPGGRV